MTHTAPPKGAVQVQAVELYRLVDQQPDTVPLEGSSGRLMALLDRGPIWPKLVVILGIQDHVVVAWDNDLQPMRLSAHPRCEVFHLRERAEICEIAAVDQDVPVWQRRQGP
eukprot:CAMPEP_0177392352 /NCGR_PEP_ID=MMETSP0368-20130122/54335_1 /TAXON_ID=447022 ORGANISM="Scrippsiella hangoei-like, Strain SHHI-4" /NCGR_SAMPLE_ID=MMETSP0368 /ASSEMBLY_ACC=CAM_ASM_000363 /LENGTH=110 /DNA_ID=CAMNT_0018858389 /DNA_START=241 /DNA_END=571 /DNA_ORIENTATION=-